MAALTAPLLNQRNAAAYSQTTKPFSFSFVFFEKAAFVFLINPQFLNKRRFAID